MTDRVTLEKAILALGRDAELLSRFKAAPASVGAGLGLDARWSEIIFRGDRDSLRQAGVNDGVTILVSRWFRDDLSDSGSQGSFKVNDASPGASTPWPENLVFAGACSHVPDLLARPEIDDPEAVERLLAGYAKLRAAIKAANPEVLIVTTDCHFQVFETGAFVVGTGAQHNGSMAFFKRPDIDLQLQGDPSLANQLVEAVRAKGGEIEAAPEVQLDHGLIVPLRLLLSMPDLPIVPIVTQPARAFSPFNARALGATLREVIERSGRRVGILATGGLSHWLDPGKFGFIDQEFDQYVLDLIRAGRGLDLANLEPFPLLSHGQYEILNWIIMLAAVGEGTRGDVYAYEPCEKSGGGWTVVNMRATKGGPTNA